MPDSGFHERLEQAVGDRTYRAVGDLTDSNAETVRRYLQGQAPSVEFIARLCDALGVSAEWLLTGAGAMRRRDVPGAAISEAGPADLLAAVAHTLESLGERVARIESFVQTLEARVRVANAPSEDGAANAETERTARARRIADAIAERPRPDDG